MIQQSGTRHRHNLNQLRKYYINKSSPEERATRYYDKAFQKILDGQRPQPNWAAAFFQGIWAVYRREYHLAFLIGFAGLTFVSLEALLPQILGGSSFLLSFVLFFSLAFHGNTYYFKSIQKKIHSTSQRNDSENNVDIPATLAIVAYTIAITTVTVMINLAQINSTTLDTVASADIVSPEKYVILNWITFIAFWICIYLCRIMPQKNENT